MMIWSSLDPKVLASILIRVAALPGGNLAAAGRASSSSLPPPKPEPPPHRP